MSLRNRIDRLSQSFPEPRADLMPGASAEDMALALLAGDIQLADIPDTEFRKREAVTAIAATIGAYPTTLGMGYPRLRGAVYPRLEAKGWCREREVQDVRGVLAEFLLPALRKNQ